MERFSETLFSSLSKQDRNEDGSPCFAVDSCENCGTPVKNQDSICTAEGERLLLCEACIEAQRQLEALADELALLPGCEARQEIVEESETVRQLVNRLRAHDLGCVRCGAVRKPTGSEQPEIQKGKVA